MVLLSLNIDGVIKSLEEASEILFSWFNDNLMKTRKAIGFKFLRLNSGNIKMQISTTVSKTLTYYLIQSYRISSNKRPLRLLNFETVRCGSY